MRALTLLAAACLALTSVAADEKKVVCYFGSWSVYRPDNGKFAIEDIDANLCTHLIYAFVGLSNNDVKVLDPWQDLPDEWGKDGFRRFNELRKSNPNLKTMVAIGGWNEGSTKYSAMASDPSSRSKFVKNAVAFVKKHKFDGFDLDWEYPAQRGGAQSDVKNFVELVKEMRAAFDKEGLLLSAAVGAAQSSASQSYNIAQISKYLHFINLMTYDLHGSWESKTGINAPLHSGSGDSDFDKQLTVEASVKYWLDQGADPKKLIVGTASYGRSFTLSNSNSAKVGAPTTGPGAAGSYTQERGMLGYNEICEMQKRHGWNVVYDEERRVPYAYNGDQWVGYDNTKSIQEKAQFINKNGLGGAMMWSIETDDFKGVCGEKYPLLKALNQVLRGGASTSAPSSPSGQSNSPSEQGQRPTTQRPTTQRPTTQKPTTNKPNGQTSPSQNTGDCTREGDMADPHVCSKFFRCVRHPNGSYTKYTFNCAAGLCFNPSAGICDWP